jgi:hypothetical protein
VVAASAMLTVPGGESPLGDSTVNDRQAAALVAALRNGIGLLLSIHVLNPFVEYIITYN